jgi:hemerythrin-like domain-containing protein
MKTTDELVKEHEGIKIMLRVLEAVSDKIKRGEKIDSGDLGGMVEFLTVFADKCHHGKEEDFLFPALEAAGIPREGGPIVVMLNEHKKGRALIARLKEAANRYKSGEREASGEFGSAAAEYVELLTQHIDKENNVLFPMANARFSAKKDDGLFKAFEKIEEERIGAGKHEEFHVLLSRLKKTYLD